MRYTDITVRPADKARIALGLRAQEFGHPDPLGSLADKGFTVRTFDDQKGLQFFFKGTRIAHSAFLNRMEFEDALPQEADAALIAVVGRIAETSAKVDKMLKADRRAVERFCETHVYTGDGQPFPFREADIFLAECVMDPKAKVQVSLRNASDPNDPHDAYEVRVRSDLVQENDDLGYAGFVYRDGAVQAAYFRKIGVETLAGLADAARPLYREAVSALDIPPAAEAPEFGPDAFALWDLVSHVGGKPQDGVLISISRGAITVRSDENRRITLLRVLRNKEGTVSVQHGGLDDGLRNALAAKAHEALTTNPVLLAKAAEVQRVSVFTEAGRLLSEEGTGYRF